MPLRILIWRRSLKRRSLAARLRRMRITWPMWTRSPGRESASQKRRNACRPWRRQRSKVLRLAPSPDQFILLFARFALDAQIGHRSGFEPLKGNVVAAPAAGSERAVINPLHGLIDLLEELLLALLEPKQKIPIHLRLRLVGGIRGD